MEAVPNTFPALFWGYAAIWFILVLYLISLGKRVRKLERECLIERRESEKIST